MTSSNEKKITVTGHLFRIRARDQLNAKPSLKPKPHFCQQSNEWYVIQVRSLQYLQRRYSEFPTQRPVTRDFDVFFDPRLNKRLSKQSRGWWFETPWRSLWRHCKLFFQDIDKNKWISECWKKLWRNPDVSQIYIYYLLPDIILDNAAWTYCEKS